MEIEEEVVGFDLQKRARSHNTHMFNNKSESEISSIGMSVVDEIINGETPIITAQHYNENGEKPIISVEDKNENGEKDEVFNGDNDIHIHMSDNGNANGGILLYPSKHEGTNGFSVDQNGADVAVSPPESNGGVEEVHARSNGTSFSKGNGTDIGLKYVESLLDESSSSVNGKLADITATELNKVNEILKSGQNELSPEAAEYDVEGVITKQETHDLFCPNCNSCITKRVILRRRKRKIQEISTGEEIISLDPGQIPTVSGGDGDQIVKPSPEEGIRQDKEVVDAPTCFSCLRIFVPTGKGFLFWKSASKPIIVHQQESSPDTSHQAHTSLSTEATAADASKDEETGKNFPMWILTCCEPYKRERETAQKGESDKPTTHDPEPPMTPPLDSPHPQSADYDKPELLTTPPVNSSDPRPTDDGHPVDTLFDATEEGKTFHSWILTCCQPSRNQTKPEQIGKTDKLIQPELEPPVAPPLDSPHPQPADDDKPELCTTPPLDSPHPQPADNDKPDLCTTPPLDSPHPQPADDDKPEPSTTLPVGSSDPRPTDDGHPIETSFDATEGKTFPSWILTCCQPSRNQIKPEQIQKTDTPVSSETEYPGAHDADISVQPKHDADDVAATTSSPNPNCDITPGHEKSFPLWFLICCQPDYKVEQTGNPDMPSPLDANSDIAPNADKLLSSEPEIPGTREADTLSFPESKLTGTPDADAPSSDSDAQNQQTMHMPGQRISPNLTMIPPDVTEPMPEIKVKLLVTQGEHPTRNLAENPHDTAPITGTEQDLEAQTELLLSSDEQPSRGVSGLDVIKAIVYGGLLETIASLSIISSASGGDATTLNIVALGLANVFGGLIVLFHNLRDLKNNRRHYEEQLGKPGHFLLHATIAIMSYLVFGLMAPVVYGFSFRKSDDKNFKLITLAAASLVCIIVLSIGKAYARRSSAKDYIKTILYYASIGVSVSGLAYVTGTLINDGLKELGVFDSNSPVNMSVLETGAVKAALSSY